MSRSYNVGALLKAQAASSPDRPAVIFPAGAGWTQLSFAELDRRSDRYARGLQAQGVRRGDRTLFLMKPSPEFYAVMFGLIKLGAVPVLVDPGMGIGNVLTCIAQIAPRVVIAIPPVHAVRVFARKTFASIEVPITAGRRWFWGGLTLDQCLGEDSEREMEAFAADDPFGIVFTSGSTGTPKGVSYTHGIFDAVARIAGEQLGRTAGTICLETFAAFVVIDIAQGLTAVVPDMNLTKPVTADPAKLYAAVAAHRPSAAFASPIVLRKLVDHARDNQLDLSCLTDALTGVAPIPPELHRDLRALNPDATLHVNYGATESLCATHITSDEILGETWELTKQGHGSCVGRPFPELTVRIIRITEDPIPTWSDDWLVPDGELGEIVVEGPVVSPEYKERPDANAAAKIDREGQILHRMGDLGYRDEGGRLWFCGRKAHRVETTEGTVPAVPIEGVFNAHDAVYRSALVGVGARGSQEPVLCVEPRPGISWSDELSREVLALAVGTRWAGRVGRLLVHPAFPVDARHNAKIRREELTTWAAGQTKALPAPVEAK